MAFSRSDPAKSPSRVALFRYQVVCAVLAHEQDGETRPDAIEMVTQTAFALDRETPRSVVQRTIYRWLRAFTDHGLAGLEPPSRKRTDTSLVLPEALLQFVRDEKRDDIAASLPELLRRAEIKGIVPSAQAIARSSLHRACLRMGITTARRKGAKVRDSRRFAYPHRMDMILSDGKHFRAGAGRVRRVAMFFLDNATRFGMHVVVGTSENKELFLRGFYETLQRYGLPGILYLDHGSAFVAGDTVAVVAKLDVLFIHGEVRYPEGHGMIEAFHRAVIAAVLRNLDGQPSCDPACDALELRLQHWLRETYNHTIHESLNGATPAQRFFGDPKAQVGVETQTFEKGQLQHVVRAIRHRHEERLALRAGPRCLHRPHMAQLSHHVFRRPHQQPQREHRRHLRHPLAALLGLLAHAFLPEGEPLSLVLFPLLGRAPRLGPQILEVHPHPLGIAGDHQQRPCLVDLQLRRRLAALVERGEILRRPPHQFLHLPLGNGRTRLRRQELHGLVERHLGRVLRGQPLHPVRVQRRRQGVRLPSAGRMVAHMNEVRTRGCGRCCGRGLVRHAIGDGGARGSRARNSAAAIGVADPALGDVGDLLLALWTGHSSPHQA